MTVAVVQARLGSTRLPRKVLRTACGRTFLEHLVERLSNSAVERIVIATSASDRDDPIVELCRRRAYECFRGSEHDVLDRYVQAARHAAADLVVRITADCPLIDPEIVDLLLAEYGRRRDGVALVTNRHPLTFPDGLDVDVMPIWALERAGREATTVSQREHVIPWFWESGQQVVNVECPENLFRQYRWTVDYEEDAILVQRIFEGLYDPSRVFGWKSIRQFVDAHPELASINAAYLPERG